MVVDFGLCPKSSIQLEKIARSTILSFNKIDFRFAKIFLHCALSIVHCAFKFLQSKNLRVLRFKLPHELNELLHALDRHGVIDRRSHAADGAVTFDVDEAGGRRFLDELRV